MTCFPRQLIDWVKKKEREKSDDRTCDSHKGKKYGRWSVMLATNNMKLVKEKFEKEREREREKGDRKEGGALGDNR